MGRKLGILGENQKANTMRYTSCFLLVLALAFATTTQAQTQNQNWRKGAARYADKSHDYALMQGTTIQDTYEAYDPYEMKLRSKLERKITKWQFKRDLKMERARNPNRYYYSNGPGLYYGYQPDPYYRFDRLLSYGFLFSLPFILR